MSKEEVLRFNKTTRWLAGIIGTLIMLIIAGVSWWIESSHEDAMKQIQGVSNQVGVLAGVVNKQATLEAKLEERLKAMSIQVEEVRKDLDELGKDVKASVTNNGNDIGRLQTEVEILKLKREVRERDQK